MMLTFTLQPIRIVKIALACLLCITNSVHAGPPFLTDDPEPVEYHHWEFYLFTNLDKNTNTDEEPNLNLPAIEFNFGLLPNLQFHLIIPYSWSLPPAAPTSSGIGDTELGFKYRFIEETTTRPQIAIFPLVEIPTGNADHNLGNSTTWYKLPIWLQKSWDQWTTYGGVGYIINHAENMRDYPYAGWLIQKSFNKSITLGMEVFTQGAVSINSQAFTLINIGGTYNLTENLIFEFSAGHSIFGENHTIAYLSLLWTMSNKISNID